MCRSTVETISGKYAQIQLCAVKIFEQYSDREIVDVSICESSGSMAYS